MAYKLWLLDSEGRKVPADKLFPLDTMTGAMVRISYAHHEIHEGNSFAANFTDETLADAETIVIAFKTAPGTKRIHLFVFFSTLVGGSLAIWQGATWTTNTGTATPIINRFQKIGTNTSSLLEDKTYTSAFSATNNVLANPTLTGGTVTPTGATSLDKQYAWGERGKIGAGHLRDENEFILKPDTTYAIVFTGIGASNKAQVSLNWYEQQDEV